VASWKKKTSSLSTVCLSCSVHYGAQADAAAGVSSLASESPGALSTGLGITVTDNSLFNFVPTPSDAGFVPAVLPAPSPPPSAAGTGDPHFVVGDGDTFDFKGVNNTVYNLVSHTNLSVNALFLHQDFELGLKKKLVHGSFMRAAYVTLKTNASRALRIEYASTRPALASVSADDGAMAMREGEELSLDDVSVSLKKHELEVVTPEWIVTVAVKVGPAIVGAQTCATGRCIINMHAKPLFDIARTKVAPHGLLAQSFDGDGIQVLGDIDNYNQQEVSTTAMGDGAIEGNASQYAVVDKFATGFAFSRFGKKVALPRNVTALSGTKVKIGMKVKIGAGAE
jgi:hypothetical protein